MKKRICLFSLYHPEGKVAGYVLHLLAELATVSERIIFISNGSLDTKGKEAVSKYTEEIIERRNTGFDGGAYKEVLLSYLHCDLSAYDELILCNDTFWGPFQALDTIFSEMECRRGDVWGFSFHQNGYDELLGSFFLVFAKNVISDERFYQYFDDCVDATTTYMPSINVTFESGLFDFLTRVCQYRYLSYTDIKNIHIYEDPYHAMVIGGMPLCKRRAIRQHYDRSTLLAILSWIRMHSTYDIDLILEDLRENFQIYLRKDEVPAKTGMDCSKIRFWYHTDATPAEIAQFVAEARQVYIWGAGIVGGRTYWRYMRSSPKFQGFLVTKPEEAGRQFLGQDVFHYEACNLENCHIIVGLNQEHTEEVRSLLGSRPNTLYLFEAITD